MIKQLNSKADTGIYNNRNGNFLTLIVREGLKVDNWILPEPRLQNKEIRSQRPPLKNGAAPAPCNTAVKKTMRRGGGGVEWCSLSVVQKFLRVFSQLPDTCGGPSHSHIYGQMGGPVISPSPTFCTGTCGGLSPPPPLHTWGGPVPTHTGTYGQMGGPLPSAMLQLQTHGGPSSLHTSQTNGWLFLQ